jgi:hypothetical protein
MGGINSPGIVAVLSILAFRGVFQFVFDGLTAKDNEAVVGYGLLSLVFLGIFFVSGATFLYRAYVAAGDQNNRARRAYFLAYGAGSFVVAYAFWYAVLIVTPLQSFSSDAFISSVKSEPDGMLVYIAEQLLSGATLDVMEVYRIRLTNIVYGPTDYLIATQTLAMRLTGSFIIASLFLRAATGVPRVIARR